MMTSSPGRTPASLRTRAARSMAMSLALACTIGAATSLSAQTYQELYSQARQAQVQKNYDLAEQKVLEALSKNPNHAPSIALLHQIKQSRPKGAGIEAKYAQVIIPVVEFKDATVQSCFEYLKQQTTKISNGQVTPNFVYNLPDSILKEKRISLRLTNVPMLVALKYITDLAGAEYRLEQFAIVITAPGAAGDSEVSQRAIQVADPALKSLTLSAVEFNETPVRDAFDTLRALAEKESGGVAKPNLVLQLPDADTRTVSINLKQVPFFEAVRLMCNLVDARFKVEPHGIIITPQPKAAPAPVEATSTGEPAAGAGEQTSTGNNLFPTQGFGN